VTLMPKPELEFFRPDHLPWRPVAASPVGGAGGAGVAEKVLSHDDATGGVTRLLRFDAGVKTTETIAHDFWEEVWILEGAVTDVAQARTFEAGMYACRPPGMRHGPYRSERGCLMFEVRYFSGKRKGG
jgi:ChrR Cupin-like domain